MSRRYITLYKRKEESTGREEDRRKRAGKLTEPSVRVDDGRECRDAAVRHGV